MVVRSADPVDGVVDARLRPTRIPRNTTCFEVEGGEIARRFLERVGMPADRADVVARRSSSTCSRRSGRGRCRGRPARSRDEPRRPWRRLRGGRRRPVGRDGVTSRDARSTAASSRRSRARPASGRPARVRALHNDGTSPAGWPGRRGQPAELDSSVPDRARGTAGSCSRASMTAAMAVVLRREPRAACRTAPASSDRRCGVGRDRPPPSAVDRHDRDADAARRGQPRSWRR